jgi:hypothetical protein
MSDKDLVGVKGWLLFLVIWLSVLSVLGAFVSYSQFWIAELDDKYITTIRAYQNYKNVFLSITIISVFIRIYSAYKLYSQHEESSVTFTKYALWITGPIASAMIAIFSLKLNYGPLLGENIKYTFINAIFALIWTLYLNKSDRVYNTYSRFAKMHANYVNENGLAQNAPVKESYLNTINNVSQSNSENEYVPAQKPTAMNQSEKIMTSNDFSMNFDTINEDELYLQATKEVDEGNQEQALWAKCMALCEGDENKAKYKYIKERVERSRDAMVKKIEEARLKYLKSIDNIKFRSLADKVKKYLEKDHFDNFKEILKQHNCNILLVQDVVQFYDENGTFRKFQDVDKFVSYFIDTYPDLVKL